MLISQVILVLAKFFPCLKRVRYKCLETLVFLNVVGLLIDPSLCLLIQTIMKFYLILGLPPSLYHQYPRGVQMFHEQNQYRLEVLLYHLVE